jgi:hypothetical protein
MRVSRVLALALAAGLLGFAGGRLLAQRQHAAAGLTDAAEPQGRGTCCPTPALASAGPAPAIPTGSGRPSLALFAVAGSAASQGTAAAVDEIEKRLAGKLDVVRMDPEEFPTEAQRWRLRLAPTLLLVSADGEELWRHEGAVTAAELQAELAAFWPELSPPGSSPHKAKSRSTTAPNPPLRRTRRPA